MFGNNDDTQNVNGNDNGAPLPPNENDDETTNLVTPADNSSAVGDPTPPADTPLVDGGSSLVEETDETATENSATVPADPMPSSDLLEIKHQALQQLSPLISHLDQTPEEKFRTTMMMIQATDDQRMVKDAYEAAKQISDDKVRAQALLDVINEINYFTQKSES